MKQKETLPYGGFNDSISLYHGECLSVMDELIAKNIKIDAILTDPPYG